MQDYLSITYKSLDIFVSFNEPRRLAFYAFAGTDRKTGEDKFEELDCFNEAALVELRKIASEALKQHLDDLAEEANYERDIRSQCYDTPYAY